MVSIRGRLAPSPTGVLHLGNARSFLLAWLDVRARGGQLLLRIEDLDGPRIQTGAADAAMADLSWLGLDYDDGPFFQRSRLSVYRDALTTLADAGLVYPCVCTRKDVESAASAPHAGDEGLVYPGTCRGRWATATEALQQTGREACWRFDTQAAQHAEITIHDRFLADRVWRVRQELGDFVVWKKDDEPAYQLAVVVDDAEQQVTDVMRADDLFSSAARQELLYLALGKPSPKWAHIPLVVGADGRRLAKRHGDTTIRSFREAGRSADEVVGLLAFWSGLRSQPLPCRATDLLPDWALEKVPSEPVVWSGAWPDLSS